MSDATEPIRAAGMSSGRVFAQGPNARCDGVGTVDLMSTDLHPESPQNTSASAAFDPDVVASHLVSVFNERAFGTIVGWSVGTWLRSETIRSLRHELEELSSVAVRGTVGLWFVQQLASATGVAMAVSCRVGDDDAADVNDDVTMIAEGADVLAMQLAETDQRWVVPDTAERKRLRERLGERIAQSATELGDDAGETAVELASCTALAAAMVVHGTWLGVDARTFGVRREVTPICPACGVATTLNQGVAGWAALRGVDPKNRVVSMDEAVVAEVYEVTCRDCGNDFSDRQVVEASIAFDEAAAAQELLND